MSWTQHHDELELWAQTLDPSIKLYTKDNWFCKALANILWFLSVVFTAGQNIYPRERFLEKSATGIAHMVFIPENYDNIEHVERVVVHEARHVKQFRYLGFFIHPVLGIPLAAVIYLFTLFPIYLAFGRFYMEMDAKITEWEWRIEEGELDYKGLIDKYSNWLNSISGPGYFWTIPKWLARYLSDPYVQPIINILYWKENDV